MNSVILIGIVDSKPEKELVKNYPIMKITLLISKNQKEQRHQIYCSQLVNKLFIKSLKVGQEVCIIGELTIKPGTTTTCVVAHTIKISNKPLTNIDLSNLPVIEIPIYKQKKAYNTIHERLQNFKKWKENKVSIIESLGLQKTFRCYAYINVIKKMWLITPNKRKPSSERLLFYYLECKATTKDLYRKDISTPKVGDVVEITGGTNYGMKVEIIDLKWV